MFSRAGPPLAALVASALVAGQVQTSYSVGTNVRITVERAGVQYYETQIATNPHDVRHLVACAYAVRADGTIDNVFYVSFDRGLTWKETLTVPASVDPACAIGSQEATFASSIHDVPGPDGKSDSTLVVHRSRDGGRTWSPSTVTVDTRRVDRAYLTVDERRGRVYVHAYLQNGKDLGGSTFVLYASTDGGRTFRQVVAREAAGSFDKPKFVPANGVVAPDGSFMALTALLDASKTNMFRGRSDEKSAPDLDGVLCLFRSIDGGKTLEQTETIDSVHYDWRVPQLSMSSLAVDAGGGPFRGRLYAVWPDGRLEKRTQIFLSTSDVGRSWTPARAVSDDGSLLKPGDRPNHFMPMVAVNKNGVVGLLWYDRRDNPDNIGYWPRFAASLDGGATWLPSVRLSTAPNASDPAETRLNSGDTAGLAADADGVFHAAWIDNRSGTHQMWTATVSVRGTVRR